MARLRMMIAIAVVGSSALFGTTGATAAQTYWCYGQPATIVGTPGDDVLVGRDGAADVIVGLGGNDSIWAAEDPYVSGSSGDRLCGGPGADYIKGAVGADRIQGGGGNDHVDGSFGYDWITQGGPGNDRVEDCDSEYDAGVRRISGGPGDDRLCVDTDAALMFGDGGNDVLVDYDCGSTSRLSGGPGDDRLESYWNNAEGVACSDGDVADRVRGGDGTDEARVSAADIVTETESVARD